MFRFAQHDNNKIDWLLNFINHLSNASIEEIL